MRKVVIYAVVPVLLACNAASADEVMGNAALALASLVAQHSPLVGLADQKVLAGLFDGDLKVSRAGGGNVSINADSVVCRASDVNLTLHTCDLVFAKHSVTVTGRVAHELFATVAEAGVPPDGAAGSSYEALSHLACAIDVREVEKLTGGGADCKFDPGPPS
jgi:hypothetical protein